MSVQYNNSSSYYFYPEHGTDAIDDIATIEKVQHSFKGFMETQQIYNAALKELSTKLDVLNDEFMVRFDHNPIHNIQTRLKSVQSIASKLIKRGFEVSTESARANIFDIAGIRVICPYIDDIYTVANMLLQQPDVVLIEKKDYIEKPKSNGYRSLHLILNTPVCLSDRTEMVPVEVQLRTMAMDFWASLEHQLRYKTDNVIPEELADRLKRCAEISADLDGEMQIIYKAINFAECMC